MATAITIESPESDRTYHKVFGIAEVSVKSTDNETEATPKAEKTVSELKANEAVSAKSGQEENSKDAATGDSQDKKNE